MAANRSRGKPSPQPSVQAQDGVRPRRAVADERKRIVTNQPAEPTEAPTRGERFRAGLKSIPRAIWFSISVVLYGVGLALSVAGRALITLSGWGPDETAEAAPYASPESER